MNKITSIFFLLIAMLSSCGQTNYPQQNPTVSEQTAAEQTSESTTAATAAEAKTTATTVPETVKQPVSTAVTAQPEQIQSVGTITVTTAENNVIQPKTTEAVTTASTPQINTVSQQTTTATTTVYEPTEEEKLIQTGKNLSNDGTDYGKAEAVYNFMRENGHGALRRILISDVVHLQRNRSGMLLYSDACTALRSRCKCGKNRRNVVCPRYSGRVLPDRKYVRIYGNR